MYLPQELKTEYFTFALDADGARLLAGGYDDVVLLDTRTGAVIQRYDLRLRKTKRPGPSTGAVNILCYSPDRNWGLACTGYHSGAYGSHQVVLLNLSTGEHRKFSSKQTASEAAIPGDELVLAAFSDDGGYVCGFENNKIWLLPTASGLRTRSATLPPGFDGRLLRRSGGSFEQNTLRRAVCDIALSGTEAQAYAAIDDHVVRIDFDRGESAIVTKGAATHMRILGWIRYDAAMRKLILLAGSSGPYRSANPPFRVCSLRLDTDPVLEAGPEIPGDPVWLSPDARQATSFRQVSSDQHELLSLDLASGRQITTSIGGARMVEISADGARALLARREGYEVVDIARAPTTNRPDQAPSG